jgi:hypothetical protein
VKWATQMKPTTAAAVQKSSASISTHSAIVCS